MSSSIRVFLFILISAALSGVYSQTLDETISKIIQFSNDSSSVLELTEYLTTIHGPRLAGSRAYLDGVNWVIDQVNSWGYTNAKLDPFDAPIIGWDLTKQSFEIISPKYASINVFPLAWTKGTEGRKISSGFYIPEIKSIKSLNIEYSGKLENKVVFLRNHTFKSEPQFDPSSLRYTKENLKSKSKAASARPLPPPEIMAQFFEQIKDSTRNVFEFFEKEGVNVLVLPSSHPHGILRVEGTYLCMKDDLRTLPVFIMGNEDFGRVSHLLGKDIDTEFGYELTTEFSYDAKRNVNVIVEVPGSDPELKNETIMIGAHFDTWHASTGATDNSANCAVLLEVIRILRELNIQLKRTLVVGLWGGEEPGVFGSRGYVKKNLFTNDELNQKGQNIQVYLNLDKGIGKIRGIELQNNEAAREVFERVFDKIPEGEFAISIENAIGSDHMVFDIYNIPSFQLLQDPINYNSITHHTNMDTFEYVIEGDLKSNVGILTSMLVTIDQLNINVPKKQSAARH